MLLSKRITHLIFMTFVRATLFPAVALLLTWGTGALSASSPESDGSEASAVEFFPLEDVEPGLIGEWHTVVDGTDIETFELRVLGISPNMAGPGSPVVICEALDPEHILTGPVGGMSGSPVYIDGKLLGAYAYGYTWPKEQAIIGVTPIKNMLDVLSFDDRQADLTAAPHGQRSSREALTFDDVDGLTETKATDAEARAADASVTFPAKSKSVAEIASTLEPVRAPLVFSGFSRKTLEAFAPQLDTLGYSWMQAPGGDSADRAAESWPLVPGSPVAAVLMTGDFSIAATGTITYRDGDTLLGFGHPFMGSGPTAMPLASARIMTVIQSVPRSFKLSETGPIAGTISQDRLTAIAGTIGPQPEMMPVNITLHNGDRTQTLSGNAMEDRQWTPLLSAIAMLEALSGSLEVSADQTVHMDAEITIDGYEPIRVRDVATGPGAAFGLAFPYFQQAGRTYDNPFEIPNFESVTFDFRLEPGEHISILREVTLGDATPEVGEDLEAIIQLGHLDEPDTFHHVSIPLPEATRGDSFTLVIADARRAEQILGDTSSPVESLDDIIAQWRGKLSSGNVYLKLIKQTNGLRVNGQKLTDIPPSLRANFGSAVNHQPLRSVREKEVWASELPVAGTFEGYYRIPFRVE